jgi:hypothetical protein
MKRALGAVSLGILGCSLRPWTPSVSVAFWAEDVPDGREYAVPSSSALSQAWHLSPAFRWSRYQKSTLIAAADPMAGRATLPDVRRLEVIAEAEAAAARLAQAGLPAGTMWLLDLRGAASAAFAARLSRDAKEPVAPVVTFNNWPAQEAIIPAEETLAGLLSFAPRLPPPDADALAGAHPVFLLDSWRLAYRGDQVDDGTFDNRYMLMPGDLPDAQTLGEMGIKHVVYVVEDLDDAEVEEDDLNASFRAWQSSGVTMYFVDLRFLREVPSVSDWHAYLAPRVTQIRERYTLVDDSRFYYRARGGFGLYYGRPLLVPGWRGGYGRGGGGSGG